MRILSYSVSDDRLEANFARSDGQTANPARLLLSLSLASLADAWVMRRMTGPSRPAAPINTHQDYMNYPHPIIAREGWPFIGIALLVAILVHALGGFGWAWPFWLLVVFVVQFFRDPPRSIPADPNAILSPADGRIVAIETVLDPYAQREAMKISVFMNVFNAHSQRSPVDGTVRSVQYFPGAFLNAELDKSSLQNERNALVFDLPGGVVISCVQVAGLVARRILCYTRVGDTLKRGQRYGFIRFGSRLDVYLPLGARPRVSIGDKVLASSTILADLAEPIARTPDTPFTAAPSGATVTGAEPVVSPVVTPVTPVTSVTPASPLTSTSTEPLGEGVVSAPATGISGTAAEVGIGSEAAPK